MRQSKLIGTLPSSNSKIKIERGAKKKIKPRASYAFKQMNRPEKLDAMTRGYEKINALIERGVRINSSKGVK